MDAPPSDGLLVVQAAATLFMTGLIWFVQIVHYPLMDRVSAQAFPRYEGLHTRRTSWVVVPPMLVEAAGCLLTVLRPPSGIPSWQTWLGFLLLLVVWISTATLQVPQHRRLAQGFKVSAHRRLVSTNWIRVCGWTLRAVLVLYWLS